MSDEGDKGVEHREGNPFSEGNPAHNFATLWDKVDVVHTQVLVNTTDLKQVVANTADIKWLKLQYKAQLCMTGGTFLTILALLYTILNNVI